MHVEELTAYGLFENIFFRPRDLDIRLGYISQGVKFRSYGPVMASLYWHFLRSWCFYKGHVI